MNATTLSRTASVFLAICLLLAGTLPAGGTASNAVSYIVQGGDLPAVIRLVEHYGGTVTSRLDVIQGVAALLSAEGARRLRAEPAIAAVTPNQVVRLVGGDDDESEGGLGRKSPAADYADVVGADVVWQRGQTGAGVTVAILDTGLGRHRGLLRGIDGQVRGRIVAWIDLVDGRRAPWDPNGHGTHVAGIIANSQIGADNEWNGVAPGVRLAGVRVLDRTGYGTYEQVIKGIQWVIENREKHNIRVMNLSLVSPVQSPYWADPLNQAVTRAWAAGITVVAASGNGGHGAMTVGVPGNNPYVITVGAFTDSYTPDDWSDDYVAPFSAAGPTLDGFVKPDLVAPGAHMVSTMLPHTYIARNHQANQVSNQYFSMAGTSQAAGVVSGIAALILGRSPSLTPDQVKHRLMVTALPWISLESGDALYSVWQQGAGRANAPDAVFSDVLGSANAGLDIQADLAGLQHYEGYSVFDEASGEFRLRGEYNAWRGGYGSWSGGYGSWSGGYGSWSGGYGSWSGGYGSWSGGYGSWSGGYGSWSGGYGSWSGGYGSWSGGYGSWSGGYGSWSGGKAAWAGAYGSPEFAAQFAAGGRPDAASSTPTINQWVNEP